MALVLATALWLGLPPLMAALLVLSAGALSTGALSGPNKEAAKARRLFRNESDKPFVGEPYERAMAYFYRGIIYWRDGEMDNARACFRSAEFEDSDAEKPWTVRIGQPPTTHGSA